MTSARALLAATAAAVLATPLVAAPAPRAARHGHQATRHASISWREHILILRPSLNRTVHSPVTVSGYADPAFENTLGVRIRDEAGHEIGHGNAMIHAQPGH